MSKCRVDRRRNYISTLCVTALALTLVGAGEASAQSRIPAEPGNYLAIAGNQTVGDRDATTVVFFQVPVGVTDTLYFGVFDADSGAAAFPDTGTDTPTTFSLYGGPGALSDPATIAASYTDEVGKNPNTGTLLVSRTADATETDLNQAWTYMPGVAPSQGERIGNFYFFKMVVTATGDRNGYRLDVSSTNYGNAWGTASGSPASIPDVRAFAYTWTPMFSQSAGVTFDLYPFVPEDATGNIQVFTWDFDNGETATGPELFDTTGALIDGDVDTSGEGTTFDVLNAANATQGNDAITLSEHPIGGAVNGTWRLRITTDGNGPAQNPVEVWFGQGAAVGVLWSSLFRAYAAEYFPEEPERVTATPADGTTVVGAVERILLQLVDPSGDPAPAVRTVYVSIDGSATIDATSDEAGPLGVTERTISTNSDGLAWVEVTNAVAETSTLTVTTDGVTAALPGPTTTDRLPVSGTLGVNDAPQVVFIADAPPTASSASGTAFNEGAIDQPIAIITITEAGSTPSITAADDIRITIPTSAAVTFDTAASVTLTVTNGGGGGAVDDDQTVVDGTPAAGYTGTLRYENGNKTAVIDIASDFDTATPDSITIDGLLLDTVGDSDTNFFLEFSFDGDTIAEVTDSALIVVQDTAVTYTWTGATDSDWNVQGNWDVGDPTPGDDGFPNMATHNVVLPGDGAGYPVILTGNEGINDLTIGSGAQLDLGANALTVNGTSSNEGRLLLDGTVAQGTGLNAGGPFDVDSGTIEYTGATVTGLAIGNQYHDLEISSTGTYTLDADLDVNGDLSISAGTLDASTFTITVEGDWTRAGTFTAGSGTVAFDGGGTSVVSGATTFNNLTVDTPGKVVRFTSGETTNVTGAFTITGVSGNNVELRPTGGAAWTINATGSVTVQFATVEESTASVALTAYSSTGEGSNTAWTFLGTTYTWAGVTPDTSVATNWSPNGNPAANDSVIIPNATPAPVADTALIVRNLTVNAGATLDMANQNLTVSDALTNIGTIALDGSQTVTATLNTDSGAVRYSGSGGLLLGTAYFDLEFDGAGPWNAAANITVNNDLAVTSGTFATAANDLSVSGALSVGGILDASGQGGGNTVAVGGVAGGTGTLTLGAGSATLSGNVSIATLNGGGGAITIPADVAVGTAFIGGAGAIDIAGSVTGAGAFTESSTTTAIGGDLTVATVSANGGTVTFDTAGPSSVGAAGVYSFNNLIIDADTTLAGNWAIGGDLTINVGDTLDTNGHDLAVGGNVAVAGALTGSAGAIDIDGNVTGAGSFTESSATTAIGGNLTVTTFNLNGTAGTVTFDNTPGSTVNAYTFTNVTVAANTSLGGVWTVNDTLTVSAGTLDMNGNAIGTVDVAVNGALANSGAAVAVTATGTAAIGNGGPATVAATVILSVTGATTIDVGAANDIALNNAANDFTTVTTTSAANVTLRDVDAIVLGPSTISGNLVVQGGGAAGHNITDSGALSVDGTTTLTAGAANVVLDEAANNFDADANGGAVSIASAVDATLVDANALDLGAIAITGNLSVIVGVGALTDSGAVDVDGTSSFTLNDGAAVDVTLDSAANTLTGTITFAGANLDNVTVVSDTDIDLAALSATGALNVTSGGTITDSGTLTIGGVTTLDATTTITIDDDGAPYSNTFGTLQLDGTDVTVFENAAIDFGLTAVTGNLDATAVAGDIADSGQITVGGATQLTVADTQSIVLDTATNDFTGAVTFSSAGTIADIAIDDASPFVIQAGLNINGNLSITADGALTDGGAVTIGGNATFITGAAADITLDGASSYAGTVAFDTTTGGTTGNVALTGVTSGVDLAATTVDGTFTVGSTGAITDSGNVSVTGLGTFTAGAGAANITLGDASTADFGSLDVTGATVSVVEGSAMTVVGATATTLTLTSNGTMDDTGALAVTGTTTLSSSGNTITLDTAANDFGTVVVNGGGIASVTDTDDIVLGGTGAAATTITVNSGGAVTDAVTGITAGTLDVTSVGAVTLDEAHAVGTFTATNTAVANIQFNNTVALIIGGITQNAASDVDINNAGAVTIGADIDTGAGDAAINRIDIDTGAGGVVDAGGFLRADTINLQTAAGSSGAVGTLANPIETDGNPTTLSLGAAAAGQPAGAFINHTGPLTINATNLAADTPLRVVASGALTLPAATIDTGTADLYLESGATLSTAAALSTSTGTLSLITGAGQLSINHTVQNTGAGTVFLSAAGGGIVQTAFISGGELLAQTIGAGNNLTLNDPANDFITVSVRAVDATVPTAFVNSVVAYRDATGFTVGDPDGTAFDSGTLGSLTLTGGGAVGHDITDTGTLIIGATATIIAGAADVTLNNGANDFATIAITSADNVTLFDTNGIDLGTSDINGTLSVTGGGLGGHDITDSGALAIDGAASFTAGAADVILNDGGNNFDDGADGGTVTVVSAADVVLVDADTLEFGTVDAAGNLTVTLAAGHLTDFGEVNVGGNSSFTLSGGAAADVILDTANNTFTGTLAFPVTNLRNLTLVDDTDIDVPTVTLAGSLNVNSTGVTTSITDSGVITVAGTTSLQATGAIVLDSANDFDSDDTGDQTTLPGATAVTLNDVDALVLGTTTISGLLTVTTGTGLTIAAAVTADGGFTHTSATTTLGVDPTTIDTSGGGGTITLAAVEAATASTEDLSLDAGAGNVALNGTVGFTTPPGSLTVTNAGNVTIDNSVTTGTVSINHTGVLLIAAAGDMNLDGSFTQTGGGTVNTAGDITTTADAVSFAGAVTLSGHVAIDTGVGAGDIAFASTVDATAAGAQNLTLDADAGNVVLVDAVGGTRLGTFTITAAANVAGNVGATADAGAITAAVIVQTAGSGTSRFGALDTDAAGGISLAGTNGIFNGAITTIGTGPVAASYATSVQIALGGDITADGAVSIAGGTVATSGDATTSDDAVLYSGPVTLTGDVAIDTGAAGGNITFDNTVNSDTANTHVLSLDAGTGNLVLDAAVGGGVPLNHIRVFGAATVSGAVNPIDISAVDVYVDAPGATIQPANDITVRRLIFYRGTLDLGTNNSTLSTVDDFAVFGASYDPDDADRATTDGADNALFAYPAAAGLAYYPGGGAYNSPTVGDFAVGTTAAFSPDLAGAAISVGSAGNGNFYVNGADMTATGAWTLTVQDNSASNPIGNPPFGAPYAVFFNGDVRNSTVTQGRISAPSAVAPHTHNNVTADGAAVVPNAPGAFSLPFTPPAIPATTNTDFGLDSATEGWDFVAPYLAYAQTVRDNVIRLTFSEAIENSNNEIGAAIASLSTNGGADAIVATYVDADATPDTLPYTFTTTDGEGDVTTFYVETGGNPWNTDATGASASVSGTATDRDGTVRTAVPDLGWIKGVFFDAGGNNGVVNYGANVAAARFTATDDGAGPVLYLVEYGRAGHEHPATRTYDGHNYLHLFYSEPIDIGGGALATTAENVRSEADAGAGTLIGGDIRDSGGLVLVDGYFTYTDPDGTGPMERGSRDGGGPANALFRTDSASPGAFNNSAQELRIYLSGYNMGTAAAEQFLGWHGSMPNINATGAVTIDVVANPAIQDVSPAANAVDHTIDTVTVVADPAGVAPGPTVAAEWLNAWDVEPPTFSTFEVNVVPVVNEVVTTEIVTRVASTAPNLVQYLEFHILDNESLDYGNVADGQEDNPAGVGLWDPQGFSSNADLTHTNTRANEGIRDISFSTLGGLTPIDAFSIEEVDIVPLLNNLSTPGLVVGFETTVEDQGVFGAPMANPDNDAYMRIELDSTGATHPWGSLTNLYVEYDATLARITDLAGNLLPSTTVPMQAIERTPPNIELALAIVGANRVYLKFSEPVFGDESDRTIPIAFNDFAVVGNPPTALEILSQSESGFTVGGVLEAFLTLQDTITADDMFSLRLRPTASDRIYDAAENAMPVSDERRLSDVAIGVVDPLWATDSFGINDAGADTGGFRTIRSFDGTEELSRTDITLQGRLNTTDANRAVSLLYDIDIGDEERVGEYWSPTVIPGLIESGATAPARTVLPFEVDGALRTFVIPGNDAEMRNGDVLEFQFRVGPLAAATSSDVSDPRTVAPWRIGIGTGFIEQRGNVTILNNVIYPDRGESTVLVYELDRPGMVTINVFSLDGSIVRTLQRGRQGQGTFRHAWDGRNNSGRAVARGIYFIRVVAPGVDEYRKVIVAR